jgi:EF-P beta-lysylation protein EpmB
MITQQHPETLTLPTTNPTTLLASLALSQTQYGVDLDPHFAMRVPPDYLAAIQSADPTDPLLRQVLPLTCENTETPGFNRDPTGDLAARAVPGLLHKYQGRALVIATTVCAIHCRYCFRRHYPYRDLPADWHTQALAYLAGDSSIHEVILSGGDPLMLNNARLETWFKSLAEIKHIRRLRVHSRVPVVLPSRIDNGLLALIRASVLPLSLVIHANHPRELTVTARRALAQLHQAGAWLFNQSVLLRGVNDHAETLRQLSEALGECRVSPYYLHQLDPVQGAAHFAVPDAEAHALMQALRVSLPGYLVPRLVRENIGAAYKQIL